MATYNNEDEVWMCDHCEEETFMQRFDAVKHERTSHEAVAKPAPSFESVKESLEAMLITEWDFDQAGQKALSLLEGFKTND